MSTKDDEPKHTMLWIENWFVPLGTGCTVRPLQSP
jgi:hypothetical protein